MKSVSLTTTAFFVIGLFWIIVAIVQESARASSLSIGVSFIAIGAVSMGESKKGGKK